MYADAYAMKMPTDYVDMSADELEYDGGWGWKSFFVSVGVAAVIGAVAVVATPVIVATIAGASIGAAIGGITTGAVAAGASSGAVTGAVGYVASEAILDVIGRD